MYRALYRKWRPATFDEVYGQPHVTRTLKNELSTGRISHAYLFTGSRGTGKTSCAKILSKAVNCLNPVNGNPCNECEICRGIDNGSIFDVIEIDAASNNGVDNIRDIREEANFTPAAAKYRVYIIDEVHMLSPGAFNALLKTLEEPPAHVIFILATTEIHKLPETILSRCQRFDFNRIPPSEIVSRLLEVAKGENISVTEEACSLIANISDGGMRDAISILDRCLSVTEEIDENVVSDVTGVAGTAQMFEFSDYISKRDYAGAIALVEDLYNGSCDIDRICSRLSDHFRNLMVAYTVNKCENLIICSKNELEKYKTEAKKFKLSKILDCIDIISQTASVLRISPNKKVQFEAAVIKMCGSLNDSVSFAGDIEDRISELEKKIESILSDNPQKIIKEIAAEKTQEEVKPDPDTGDNEDKPADAPAVQAVKETKTDSSDENLPEGDFMEWSEVLELLMKSDVPLYGIMTDSSASVVNGRMVIKTGNPVLSDFIANKEDRTHYTELMRAIFNVTGKKPKIVVNTINNKTPQNDEKTPLQTLTEKINIFNQGDSN